MIKHYLLLIILISGFNYNADAGRKLRVLFIGNSYTYVNNLPQMIANIANTTGDTLIYDSYAPGGYKLGDHCFDTMTSKKIKSGKWDYIVLQEQSRMPAMPTGYFFTQSYHWAHNLDTIIEHSNPCTKTMFYMTWGRENGDSVFCAAFPTWPAFCTYESMDSVIRLRYMAYIDTTIPSTLGVTLDPNTWFAPVRPSRVTPVGAVRHYIRHHYSNIGLYQSDGSHPSLAGTYAAACSFFTTLFRKDPTAITFNPSLNVTDAMNIRTAVKLVVYDSLSKWHACQPDLFPDFTYNVGTGNQCSFTNSSIAATNYLWSFDDGTTSTMKNPVHTYATKGVYTVRLVVTNNSCTDTIYKVVDMISTGIAANNVYEKQGFIISPKPAASTLNIKAPPGNELYYVYIMNMLGKIVYREEHVNLNNHTIDVSMYNTGIYMIRIISPGNHIYQDRFSKL